ncbi:hypothetical protein OROGR_005541 [Orobanche gracilis]
MVVDLLAGKHPRVPEAEMPTYMRRALHFIPQAWTSDLDHIARQRSPEAAQALMALSLQAAVLSTQVARDAEMSPSREKLQAAVDAEKYEKEQAVEKAAVLEKELAASKVSAAEMAKKLGEANAARQRDQVALRNLAAQLEAADAKAKELEDKAARVEKEKAEADRQIAIADGRALAAAKEAGDALEMFQRVSKELADLKAKAESDSLDPFNSVECMSDLAYFLAYADAIRAVAKAGQEVGVLVEAFKAYTVEHPLDPCFMLPILDLSTEHGVDLSWYPTQDTLMMSPPPVPEQEPVAEPSLQAESAAEK